MKRHRVVFCVMATTFSLPTLAFAEPESPARRAVVPAEAAGIVSRPPAFIVYQGRVSKQIKSKWQWPKTGPVHVAHATVEITDTGELRSPRIVLSSGDEAFDRSVLAAIEDASPVPPPPESVREMFRTVRLQFDSRE